MNIPDFKMFTGKQFQDTLTMLLICERNGADVRVIRTMIEGYYKNRREELRKSRKKTPPKIPPNKPSPLKETVVKQSHIPCPEKECGGGYLQIKHREGVTYTVCSQCTKSVEFK